MGDTTELVPIRQSDQVPERSLERVRSVAELVERKKHVHEVMRQVMRDGEHYGHIPGTGGDKKTLLKPGAEILSFTFRLMPQFDVILREMGNGHREYEVKCRLSDGTEGVGTCSTLESKYRYRQGSRKCPKCGKEAIIKGKKEFGGGWVCFKKKDPPGCGAKFPDGDPAIESQSSGKIENPDPADQYNTVLKIAKKRAHVDAVITATAASDTFTQDVGDTEREEPVPTPPPTPPSMAPEGVWRGIIADVSSKSDVTKPGPDGKGGGKPYTLTTVTGSDGARFTTFDTKIKEAAEKIEGDVAITYKQTPKGDYRIEGIEPIVDAALDVTGDDDIPF